MEKIARSMRIVFVCSVVLLTMSTARYGLLAHVRWGAVDAAPPTFLYSIDAGVTSVPRRRHEEVSIPTIVVGTGLWTPASVFVQNDGMRAIRVTTECPKFRAPLWAPETESYVAMFGVSVSSTHRTFLSDMGTPTPRLSWDVLPLVPIDAITVTKHLAAPFPRLELRARVDGDRVFIEARDSVVEECEFKLDVDWF